MSKKSIKDLFDVAQSHGPNYVDDNPRIKAGASFARYQQEFCKKFTSSIANRCSILFFNDKRLQKRRLSFCWYMQIFLYQVKEERFKIFKTIWTRVRGQVKFNVVHRHIGVKRRLEGTFMSQNRISFSSVLKAEGAEQSANQRAKRFVRAMGKNKVHEIADTVSLYRYFEKGCRKKCARDNPER